MTQKTKYARLLKPGDKFMDYGAVRTVQDVTREGHLWYVRIEGRQLIPLYLDDRVTLA